MQHTIPKNRMLAESLWACWHAVHSYSLTEPLAWPVLFMPGGYYMFQCEWCCIHMDSTPSGPHGENKQTVRQNGKMAKWSMVSVPWKQLKWGHSHQTLLPKVGNHKGGVKYIKLNYFVYCLQVTGKTGFDSHPSPVCSSHSNQNAVFSSWHYRHFILL